MTSRLITNRLVDNQIIVNNQQSLVAYVTNVEDFISLRENVPHFKSNISFELKQEYVNFLYSLKNQPIKEINLDYNLYCELKNLLEVN